MAIHAPFFIAWASVHYVAVCQHCPSFIRNIEEIAVALEALFILKRGIGSLAGLLMVIFSADKMNYNILNSVSGF